MTTIRKIYDKFIQGDPLTDDELAHGIQHFSTLDKLLGESGPIFELASNEACRVYHRLREYQDARKRNL